MRRVAAYFALACALSWAWWIPVAVTQPAVERGDGWPTHVPGLLGPLLAAVIVTAVTDRRAGLRELGRSMVRLPATRGAWLATAAPLLLIAIAVAVAAVVGDAPSAHDFRSFSGAAPGVLVLAGVVLVNGFGEETGWRGYALRTLDPVVGRDRAVALVTAGWAIWHVPLFFVLASFSGFGPLMLVGWAIGLAAGSVVLADVYFRAGSSVLAAAVWHVTYNLGAGTAAGDGLLALVLTAAVIFWAVSIIRRRPADAGPWSLRIRRPRGSRMLDA